MNRNIAKIKPSYMLVLLLILCGIFFIISLGIGAVSISPVEVIAAILGRGESNHAFIIENYRLPRIILALLVGSGLAVSGAVLQGIIRNPLASPDVIGFTKGAGLAAAIVILLFPKSPIYMLPVSAFMGAAVVAVVLYLFSYKQGAKPATLALVGIALGALCHAGIQYLMIKFPIGINAALVWLTGSLWGRSWIHVEGLLPWMISLLPLTYILAVKLDILNLGDSVAEGLGENVKRSRLVLLAVAVALAGSCVAVAGSIGFVGLVAPHMARRLVGARHMLLIPVAAMLGSILVLIADTLGRWILLPVEIPAGLITAIIGAPYFLYLLRKETRS